MTVVPGTRLERVERDVEVGDTQRAGEVVEGAAGEHHERHVELTRQLRHPRGRAVSAVHPEHGRRVIPGHARRHDALDVLVLRELVHHRLRQPLREQRTGIGPVQRYP